MISIRSILLLTIFLLFSINASAQSSGMEPLDHELRVYPDPESGSLFWPLDKPVYVRLSTSPDGDAESHLLQKMFIRGDEGRQETDDNHIDLDMSGNQFIRWVNANTQDTLMLQFQADGLPPESRIVFDGAERHEQDGTVYYGQGLSANISARDRHSGVQKSFLSINGETFTQLEDPVSLSEEIITELWFYSVDNVGNVEKPTSTTIQIDLSAPESSHFITGIHQDNILSTGARFNLESSDQLSGVKQIYYRLQDSDEFQSYPADGISVQDLADGSYNFSYYAVDNVGNEEEINEFQFYLDRTAPQPEIAVNGDQHATDDEIYVSARTTFSLSATDNRSGVAHIRYSVDGQEQGNYIDAFRLPGVNGTRSVTFTATDQMENTSSPITQTYEMDVTPPVTTYQFDGSHYNERNMYWITSDTKIVLEASDEKSGVQEIYYDLQGDIPETVFEDPFNISDEGRYNFSFYSKDRVNNAEGLHFVLLIVDDTPPEIMVNFNTRSQETRTNSDEKEVEVYRAGTRIFLAATDESSGARHIRYRINDQENYSEYQQPIVFEESGEYQLNIYATDNVGNRVEEVLNFIIAD